MQSEHTNAPITVAVIGCGVAALAIHVPTLMRLGRRVRVLATCDARIAAAQRVARAFNAPAFETHTEMLSIFKPDVVLIATSDETHAQIALDAMNLGVRTILIEKPLAQTVRQLDAMERTARETGSTVIAGTMLSHDPVVRESIAWFREEAGPVTTLDVRCWLPWNEKVIADAIDPELLPDMASRHTLPKEDSEIARLLMLALVSHNLPQVRALVGPQLVPVEVRLRRPLGCWAIFSTTSAIVRIDVRFDDAAAPEWSLRATTHTCQLWIDFPPSYVQAGGAKVQMQDANGFRIPHRSSLSPYAAMWGQVLDLHGQQSAPGHLAPDTAVAFDEARMCVELAAAVAGRFQPQRRPDAA